MPVSPGVAAWLNETLLREMRRFVSEMHKKDQLSRSQAAYCDVVMEKTGATMRLFDTEAATRAFPMIVHPDHEEYRGADYDVFRAARDAFGVCSVDSVGRKTSGSYGSTREDEQDIADRIRQGGPVYFSIQKQEGVDNLDGILMHGELRQKLGSGSFGCVTLFVPRSSGVPLVIKMQDIETQSKEYLRITVAKENLIHKTLCLNQQVTGALPTLSIPFSPKLVFFDWDVYNSGRGKKKARNVDFVKKMLEKGCFTNDKRVKSGSGVSVSIMELAWGDAYVLCEYLCKTEKTLGATQICTVAFDIAYRLCAGGGRYGFLHKDLKPANLFVMGVTDTDFISTVDTRPAFLNNTMVLTQCSIHKDGERHVWTIPRKSNVLVDKGRIITGGDRGVSDYLSDRGDPRVINVGIPPMYNETDPVADFEIQIGDFGFSQTTQYVDTQRVFTNVERSAASATDRFTGLERYFYSDRETFEAKLVNDPVLHLQVSDMFAFGATMLDFALAGWATPEIRFRGRGGGSSSFSSIRSKRLSESYGLVSLILDDRHNRPIVEFKEELVRTYGIQSSKKAGKLAYLFILQFIVGNGLPDRMDVSNFFKREEYEFRSDGVRLLDDMRNAASEIRKLFEEAMTGYEVRVSNTGPYKSSGPGGPFEEMMNRVIHESFGEAGISLIRRCLNWNPANRPKSFFEVLSHRYFDRFLGRHTHHKEIYKKPDGSVFTNVEVVKRYCRLKTELIRKENAAVEKVWAQSGIKNYKDTEDLLFILNETFDSESHSDYESDYESEYGDTYNNDTPTGPLLNPLGVFGKTAKINSYNQ